MEAVNILYNRQKFGDGRQLRRAKSVLQTMFLDSDLKELAEGGVPIEEVNAMQKQRDEHNKTRLQESASDASPIKPRQLEKELREVRKECVADLHSSEDCDGNSEADSEKSIDVEEEFPSNRKKRERAQRGQGRGGPKIREEGAGVGVLSQKKFLHLNGKQVLHQKN